MEDALTLHCFMHIGQIESNQLSAPFSESRRVIPVCPESPSLLGEDGGMPGSAPKGCRQVGVDAGQWPKATTEVKRLERKNAELERVDMILKSASVFFAAEPDRSRR